MRISDRSSDVCSSDLASKTDIARWTQLTRGYLKGRPQLRRICLLIDARHGIKGSDRQVMEELDTAAVSYQIVLTKADKMKPGPLQRMVEETETAVARHPAAHSRCLTTSSESGSGIAELRAALAAPADPAIGRPTCRASGCQPVWNPGG